MDGEQQAGMRLASVHRQIQVTIHGSSARNLKMGTNETYLMIWFRGVRIISPHTLGILTHACKMFVSFVACSALSFCLHTSMNLPYTSARTLAVSRCSSFHARHRPATISDQNLNDWRGSRTLGCSGVL